MNTFTNLKAINYTNTDSYTLFKNYHYRQQTYSFKSFALIRLKFIPTPTFQEEVQNDPNNQFQNNILENRHIHIDIIIDKYKEISQKINAVLNDIESSENAYNSLDESIENITIKENIQKNNFSKLHYLESLKQQALKLNAEIERFSASKGAVNSNYALISYGYKPTYINSNNPDTTRTF